jgi:hypothetical protein
MPAQSRHGLDGLRLGLDAAVADDRAQQRGGLRQVEHAQLDAVHVLEAGERAAARHHCEDAARARQQGLLWAPSAALSRITSAWSSAARAWN